MLNKEKLVEILEKETTIKYIKIKTKEKELWFKDVKLHLPSRWGIVLLCGVGKPERVYKVKTLLTFIKMLERNHPIYAYEVDTASAYLPLVDTYSIEDDTLVLEQVKGE